MDEKTAKYYELMKQKKQIEEEMDDLCVAPIKLYKFTGYFADIHGRFDSDGLVFENIEYAIDDKLDGTFNLFNGEKVDIIWHDEIDINYRNVSKEVYEKYFK